jgi:RimJ/RimL family protein N-acetyltransferase
MPSLDDIWPLYGLRLRIGDIELRLPNESDLAKLATLTLDPIHDPATMPFSVPWTDLPPEQRMRGTYKWHLKARAEWRPDEWRLELIAERGGVIVGTQALHGTQFSVTRQADSGSWVGRQYQRRGVATATRQAIVHLAFAGLGAETLRSSAFADNAASLRVSEKLGYQLDGTDTYVRQGQPATMIRLVLTRDAWEKCCPAWPAITVEGLAPCLPTFGLTGE